MTLEIIPIDAARTYPPRVTRFTAAFWQALQQGLLKTTRCESCQQLSFPPKPICPHCWTEGVSWQTLSGAGTLYSWTRIHAGPAIFEPELPYEVGVVDLNDGLRLACRLHGPAGTPWRCGMPVRIVTLKYRDGPLLAARPA
ncbi:Zn-ribbon domain-containing OB-fold protein [Steroidobacter flavus]|uniref:Zn-ribbon domain-containing OB-fold protein n=1 Tax=Steroidobacter flavus TaxID=1842136 RepID=A0ABV8SX93_9GAMM